MRNSIKQIASLATLLGASALVGCASQVLTTDEWAISNGYQRVEFKGKEHFCHPTLGTTGSNRSTATCFTLAHLSAIRWAGPPAAQGFPYTQEPVASEPPYIPIPPG